MYYELITQYQEGTLTANERLAFELKLKEDKALQEDYALYLAINNTMENTSTPTQLNALQETLQPLQAQYFNTNAVKRLTPVKRLYYIAAAVAAITIIALIILPNYNTKRYTSQELYAYYANYESIDNTTRGSITYTDSILQLATQYYNVKQYAQAITYYTKLNALQPDAAFALAICQLETNDYAAATLSLKALANGSTVYQEKAQYTLALLYLKQGDKVMCTTQLNTIPNTSAYYAKAKELLSKL